MVSIFGPAGIGKTRLLAEFERAEGLPVFRIHCRETEMEPLAAIRRLLDQLRSFSQLADHAKPPGTMGELFRCILDELRKVCAAQVYALVIEDAHWAAPDVRAFVNYIIDALNVLESKPRILILVTFREFSVADSARAGFIETLLRERHALQLPPLSAGEIAAMVPADQFGERIFFELARLSEGNPLYVQELIPVLREGGVGSLPSRVQTATRTTLATLSKSARRALYAASVIGVHFSFEDVAALCDTPNDALLDALQEASDNRFVQPGPSNSTYRFRHALIREIVYCALLPANAIRLHRRAARAIARSRRCRAHLAELAAHCERAGWPRRASILFLRSGMAAEELHDFESAASAYLRARSSAPAHDARLAVLAARHANCLFAIGALEEAADAFAEAAALYDRIGSVEMAANLVDRRSVCLERVGEPQRALRELDAMLLRTKNTLPEVAARIVLSGASLSQAYRPLLAREYDKWCTHMQHARHPQASASHGIGEMKFEAIREVQEGRWLRGMQAFDRALELAGRLGDSEDKFGTAVLAAKYHALGGDVARSSALFRHAYVIGKSENSTWMQHLAGTRLVRLLVFSGCIGEARTLLERCVELPAYSHLMQISVATNALLLGVLQDDAGLVDRFLDQRYIDMGLRYPSSAVLCDVGFSYGMALRSRNRIDEARDLVSKILDHIHQPWEARPFLAMTSLWGAARQASRAQQLLTTSMQVPGAKGYVHLCVGHARQRSNDPRSRHDGQRAAQEFRNGGLRLFEAIAYELAQDRKRAVALYQSCGSVYDIARLTGLRSNDELFTIRQRQIVELVIRGDTNKRIAEALGIATGTVGAHLAMIYRNHGVSSRAQLVASVLAGRSPSQQTRTRPPASLSH